ncbi:MAG: glycosyltransferase family 4 protein [Roseovarius sp.]
MPELIVTNLNRHFTGVSATAAAVLRWQAERYDLALAGHPLPGCPAPIPLRAAIAASRRPPPGRAVTLWHVRRNPEMRAALFARDVLRLPVRIIFTSAAIRRHSALPRWLIGRMDAVIATSEAAAAWVPHVRAVVPHGVDTGRFVPAADRAAAWAATGWPGRAGIATIGRIRAEKGTDRFVAAMLRVLPAHPGLTALVIGRAARADRPFLARLKAEIAAAGLAGRILFPGEIAPEALPALMRALSLVVQLPRYEGYGMVPLEAMASGVPFVATDQGHYRAFAAAGRAGVIVPEQDGDLAAPQGPARQAAEAIAALLGDAERHAAMARAARELACARFSVAREGEGIAAVYEQLWAG